MYEKNKEYALQRCGRLKIKTKVNIIFVPHSFEEKNNTYNLKRRCKMKKSIYTFLTVLLGIFFVFVNGCSRIEIQNPNEDEKNITTPYTLVVKHTGCGTVKPETFKAWLDKDSNTPQDITNDFSYSQDTWTASDYNLSMGTHTLSVSADVTTGSWCREVKSSDNRTFFVAPCTDFVTAWGVDFELSPNTLTIEYDTNVIEIAQQETKIINLPENSPLLVDGKLPVNIKYGIRNKTSKNLKFLVFLRHGDTILYSKDLAFCGEGVVDEQHLVDLTPSSEPLTLTVEAGDILVSPSDDTRPVFFNGKLQLRVYPL